jgi:hypothetical protein
MSLKMLYFWGIQEILTQQSLYFINQRHQVPSDPSFCALLSLLTFWWARDLFEMSGEF